MIKKIIVLIYFLLVTLTFIYTARNKGFDINAVDVFFGILLPCFFFWLVYIWLSKSERSSDNSKVVAANSFFYYLCFLVGVAVLVKIGLDQSKATIYFVLLPFIQGLVYLTGAAVIAHLFVLSKPDGKV